MSASPRILIVGAAGQVGTELQRSFAGSGEIAAVDRESVDLAAAEQVRELVRRVKPTIILNAAAYTGVDRAEKEPDLAMAVNAGAPGILAEEALALDALLVHYSTDYVFDGSKRGAWTEEDAPAPLSSMERVSWPAKRLYAGQAGGILFSEPVGYTGRMALIFC